MPDPTEPGWRPEYRGDSSLGDVGSGEDFGAALYELYRAGRNLLPELATVYSELTTEVDSVRGPMTSSFSLPNRGISLAHRLLMDLRDEVHLAFRQTSVRVHEVGDALVVIADMYAATDQEAADEFARLIDENPELYKDPPPAVPEPPPVEPPPAQHGHPDLVPH